MCDPGWGPWYRKNAMKNIIGTIDKIQILYK